MPGAADDGMRPETHLVTFGLGSNLNDVNVFPHAGDEFSEAMWDLEHAVSQGHQVLPRAGSWWPFPLGQAP